MKNQSFLNRSLISALYNMALVVILSGALLWKLDQLSKKKVFGQEKVEQVKAPAHAGDSTGVRTVITPMPPVSSTPSPGEKPFVNFFDIITLMLIAGAMGGTLCNLRGIFVYYRDDGGLDDDLFIPYMTRPFTGAVCGLFIYFVSSLLVTSITLIPTAEGIGFQGMISYVAMAIVAGFGSQEFMEKLKALAVTLFGEKQQKSTAQQLKGWHKLMERGVITSEEFAQIKGKEMEKTPDSGSDFEVFKGGGANFEQKEK